MTAFGVEQHSTHGTARMARHGVRPRLVVLAEQPQPRGAASHAVCCAELEEPGTSIDTHRDVVYELLAFALQPRKSGLGGVDKYLIGKLCRDKPRTIKDAMLRLCKGMNNSIQVPPPPTPAHATSTQAPAHAT